MYTAYEELHAIIDMREEQLRVAVDMAEQSHAFAVTAVTATRDALARLWLPPDEIVALAQRAAAAGCLSDDAHHWLRRIEIERRRQKKSPAGEGEAVG